MRLRMYSANESLRSTGLVKVNRYRVYRFRFRGVELQYSFTVIATSIDARPLSLVVVYATLRVLVSLPFPFSFLQVLFLYMFLVQGLGRGLKSFWIPSHIESRWEGLIFPCLLPGRSHLAYIYIHKVRMLPNRNRSSSVCERIGENFLRT